MAAKLLHSLAEDKSELQKQIGCMTGIFQLFDHQHILTGKRTAHKRLLLGNSRSDSGNLRRENSITHHRENIKESTVNRSVDDGQRVVTESSGASFSSSRSSSFSSMEFNRASLPETSSFDRIIFSRTPSKGPDSLDLRDIVKECMYREARTLPVKLIEEKTVNNLSKHRDSSGSSQSKDGSSKVAINAKKNIDLDESVKVLAKLRDAPWYYNEAKQLQKTSYEAKDGTRHSGSRDVPHFSYEEKERNRLSFEVIKSAPKQKELPRLSLDGREGSMKSIPSHLSRNFQSNGLSNEKSPEKRVPGVVAKLMGLEALPHSSLAGSKKTSSKVSLIRTVETVDFPKNPVEVSTPLQRKSEDRMMKPIQSSMLPLEIAPWSQFDGNRGSSKTSLGANSSPVYSEIEKRLKNIEFKQSGKDTRTLKQILEAMQSKGLIGLESKEGGSNMIFRKDYEPNTASPRQINGVILHRNKQSNQVMGWTTHEPYSSSVLESQIVVMKPASLMGKSNVSVSSVIQKGGHRRLPVVKKSAASRVLKDQSPRNSIRDSSGSTSYEKRPNTRNVTLPQPSSKSQQFGQGSTLGSMKTSGSLSPRLQQKKPEPDNRFHPPTPPDSDKLRRTSNGRATNLSSPSGTSRRKSCSLLQSDNQLSEISNASRSLSYTGDEISQLSDDNLSSYPKMNIESMSSILPAKYVPTRSMKKNSNFMCDEDDSWVIKSPEHPSPVSVLDPSAYRDDELSPVKKISNTLEGDHTLDGDNFFVEDQWRSPDDLLPQSMASVPINHQKLQNIDNLVKKLRGLNSHHDEVKTDYVALLCKNTNPDFRYISEILLASGLLLRDLSSGMKTFQLHPSGHPINPELFFVLEQTKASSLSSKEGNNLLGVAEKSRRKLIFDVVNEILARKLQPISISSEPFLSRNRVGSKTLTAQKLLKKLCCEIEQFRAKSLDNDDDNDGLKNFLRVDLMNTEENWMDFHDEISGAVLDIERLIFKNLVDEIVVSEGAYLRAKSGRDRQLLA